jgi:hypothetical protein
MAGPQNEVAALPFHPDDLIAFLDDLRTSGGYNIGVEQYVAVHDLFVTLAAQHRRGAAPYEFARLIGPILCTSPREQEEFPERLERWMGRSTSLAASVPDRTTDIETTLGRVERQSRWWYWLLGNVVVLMLVSLAVTLWRTPTGPVVVPPPTPQANPPATPWLEIMASLPAWLFGATAALAIVWAIGRFLWKRHHAHAFLERRQAATDPRIERITLRQLRYELFSRVAMLRLAREFRRRVDRHSTDLAIAPTALATVRNGGAFTPVFDVRRVAPEYLALIDAAGPDDHQARFIRELVDGLADDGVFIRVYYFDGDPRICFPAKGGPPRTLLDLATQFHDDRLLIFCDGRRLINPFTGGLEPWVDRLRAWAWRALLTPNAIHEWGAREEALAQIATLVPATLEGLAQLFQQTAVRPREAGSFAVPLTSPAPQDLLSRPQRWIQHSEPSGEQIDSVIAGLERHLDSAGFAWLCACAVYPRLDWNLTVNLGYHLHTDDGNTFLNPARLATLARLPWFRYGYMPDWFRLRLLRMMPESLEREVRELLQALLLTAVGSRGQAFEVEVALEHRGALSTLARTVLGYLSRGADQGPLRDHVFLQFMSGRSAEPLLAVRVPRAIVELFSRAPSARPPLDRAAQPLASRIVRAERAIEYATMSAYLVAAVASNGTFNVLLLDHWDLIVEHVAITTLPHSLALCMLAVSRIRRHTRLRVMGLTASAAWATGMLFLPLGSYREFSSSPTFWGPIGLSAVLLPLVHLTSRRYDPGVRADMSARLTWLRNRAFLAGPMCAMVLLLSNEAFHPIRWGTGALVTFSIVVTVASGFLSAATALLSKHPFVAVLSVMELALLFTSTTFGAVENLEIAVVPVTAAFVVHVGIVRFMARAEAASARRLDSSEPASRLSGDERAVGAMCGLYVPLIIRMFADAPDEYLLVASATLACLGVVCGLNPPRLLWTVAGMVAGFVTLTLVESFTDIIPTMTRMHHVTHGRELLLSVTIGAFIGLVAYRLAALRLSRRSESRAAATSPAAA